MGKKLKTKFKWTGKDRFDYIPEIPCPLYEKQHSVIVTPNYCTESRCVWFSHYHLDGVECMHGDDNWKQQLTAKGVIF